MGLPRYITLSEAAVRLSANLTELNHLIKNGTLKAVQISGETVVSEPSVASYKVGGKKVQPISLGRPDGKKKEDMPEYQRFAELAGVEIWANEAARKYDLAQQTITRWVNKGYIKTIGNKKNRILLNEQDVAYCVFVYRRAKELGYRWVFYSDGTPYEPRTKKESESDAVEENQPTPVS